MTTALEVDKGPASRPGRSLHLGKTRYPLYRRLGGPQSRSGQVRKISPPPPRVRSPGHPARSQSLYRLRYPAHILLYTSRKIVTIAKNDSLKEVKLEKKNDDFCCHAWFLSLSSFAHQTFRYVSLLYRTSSENIDS
jgi:hypothetical protein